MSEIDKNVDPALWPLVESFPPIEIGAQTLNGFRAAMVELSVVPEASSHADVRIQEIRIPVGGDGARTIRCLLFTPTQRSAAAALLHIHGGGFVMGSPEMDVARNIELVRATGCAILSVDYRLAPEHPHPAGLEDCHAALVWLADQADVLGFPAGRIGDRRKRGGRTCGGARAARAGSAVGCARLPGADLSDAHAAGAVARRHRARCACRALHLDPGVE